METLQLIKGIGESDNKAIAFFYKEYKPYILKVIKQRGLMNSNDRETVASDVIITFWEICKKGDFELTNNAKLTSYLYAVAKNLTLKFFANKNNKHSDISDISDINNVYSDGSFEKSDDDSLYSEGGFRKFSFDKVVETLSEANKVALGLMMDGVSMNDIAKEMGYKNSNVAKTKKLKLKNIIKLRLEEMNFTEANL